MSQRLNFDFSQRPLVPYAHDYAHGDAESWHHHDCAQLIHTLSGVVKVETRQGSWIVPPSRGVWLPAGTGHALHIVGAVAARTLARHFNRETGLQFSDWVRRARLSVALARLAQGETVLTVALELGYDSPSAFSAMFRRVLGVTPANYFPAAEKRGLR